MIFDPGAAFSVPPTSTLSPALRVPCTTCKLAFNRPQLDRHGLHRRFIWREDFDEIRSPGSSTVEAWGTRIAFFSCSTGAVTRANSPGRSHGVRIRKERGDLDVPVEVFTCRLTKSNLPGSGYSDPSASRSLSFAFRSSGFSAWSFREERGRPEILGFRDREIHFHRIDPARAG